jgi:starch synthase
MINHNPLRVLYMASEADPFVRVGGLGDVAGSLPSALRGLIQNPFIQSKEGIEYKGSGLDIRLVIPFHSAIQQRARSYHLVASFNISHKDGPIPAEVFDTDLDGLPVYLVSGPPFSAGAPVYTGNNTIDGHKYTFFSLAALKLPRVLGWRPHILHANDWHTAPAVYALKKYQTADEFYTGMRAVLSIHNLPYLGTGAGQALQGYGLLPASDSRLPEWAQSLPLPLGLLTADRIVAVSPTYFREILTAEFGSGLDEFLQSRSKSITGILNGIDIHQWDPMKDTQIFANYSGKEISSRDANKAALTHELGLDPNPRLPLLAMINRMDPQKGVDLALEALRQLAEKQPELGWQAVLLGTGVSNLEAASLKLASDFPGRVRAAIRFDATLSRRIYAGADMMLVPSRYEPCGLVQMIAMRYGCVPIAHATGGLRDTIRDAVVPKATGFLFQEANSQALLETILRAISTYEDRQRWRRLQRNGMSQDFSWENSARQYLQLYQTLHKSKRLPLEQEREK